MITKKYLAIFAGAFFAAVVTLVGLAPQRATAQFPGQVLNGGTAGGTANAPTITIQNWSRNLVGVPITFTPASDNTAATQINVSGLGLVTVQRPSSIGLVAFSGHEFKAGVLTTIQFDGTNFDLVGPLDTRPIGDTAQIRGASAPPGYLIEDGSCVSQTTYAPLFTVIGTTYGSCSAGLFALPDSRGDNFIALDGQGANGNAGRITTASCGNPNTRGQQCGQETKVVISSNIQQFTATVNTSGGLSLPTTAGSWNNNTGNTTGTGGGDFPQGTAAVGNTNNMTGPIGSASPTGLITLPPSILGIRVIKY